MNEVVRLDAIAYRRSRGNSAVTAWRLDFVLTGDRREGA
jgi:hypothetical protein